MSSKLLKRLISGVLALTLVFSINGFAAVVTDNDGSAFITKAEFDSLKNTFQSQIDSYNQSIDDKIDGAIAAYLSGIRITTETEIPNFYNKYKISGYSSDYDLIWSSLSSLDSATTTEKQLKFLEKDFKGHYELAAVQIYMTSGSYGAQVLVPVTWSGTYPDDISNDKVVLFKEDNASGLIQQFLSTERNQFTQNLAYKLQEITPGTITGVDTYKKNENRNIGNMSLYSNLGAYSGKIWPNGINGGGEIAANATNFNVAHGTIPNINQIAVTIYWVDSQSTTSPRIYPLGTNIKVNAARQDSTDAASKGFNTGWVTYTGQDYTYDAVEKAWADGKGTSWLIGENANRAVYINTNHSAKHYASPKGFTMRQVTAEEMKFKDFINIHPSNSRIKGGIVLADLPDEPGKIKFSCKPSNKGKIYMWQSNAPDYTWGGARAGSSINDSKFPYIVDVTNANTTWRCEFENEVDKKYLYFVYVPSSTTSHEGTIDNVVLKFVAES